MSATRSCRSIGQVLLDDGSLEIKAGAQFLHDLGGSADGEGGHAPAEREGLDHVPDTGMRRGDDEGLALEDRIGNERLGRQRFLEGNGNLKYGAFAFLAFDPDVAAHHLRQFAADGEAEAGAAIFARGGSIDLGEGLEEAVDLVGGNADAGVTNGEEDEVVAAFVFRPADADADVALGGEPHGVGEEVDQDLPQARNIAVETGRQVRLNDASKDRCLFRRTGAPRNRRLPRPAREGRRDGPRARACPIRFWKSRGSR